MPASSQITEKLLNTVESLQNDDPDSACQILLVCAVYQNYAYHRKIALEIVQRALTLAEHKGIVKARIWSAWGAAAIYFQDKAYGQTATYLKYLKTLLGQQNEWILANFVDIVQQSLEPTGISWGYFEHCF
jgi:hypothetical protein